MKIKANGTEDPDAITITPSSAGLSGQGGRDQVLYMLVRNDTSLSLKGDDVATIDSADTANLVFNPVWNHAGDKFVYMNNAGGVWNIYKREYSAGAWGPSIRLTGGGMNLRANAQVSWNGTDQYVVFSAMDDVNPETEMYAVKQSHTAGLGDDANKTLAQLRTANQKLSNLAYSAANQRRWADADWSRTLCLNGYQDSIVSSMATIVNNGVRGSDLWLVNGLKDLTNGLYIETNGAFSSTVTQLTDLPDSPFQYAIEPRWSHDCSKIVFVVVDGVGEPGKTSIYIMNLTDAAWGATVAAFPVTSLSAAGMYKVHECTTANCSAYPALFPSFSSDDTFIFHAVDTTSTLSVRDLQKADIQGELFTGKNFDNYAVYIQNQPTYVRQEVGQSSNNEFGLMQCNGASCPDSAQGNPIMTVTQSGATKGDVRVMYLTNESTVSTNGGLCFMDGAVAAVIPPGALTAETEINVATPSWTPSPEDGEDLLVSTGEAREFFPDGVVFNEDILMLFHYTDATNDGLIDGVGYDEDKIYVYYWCDSTSTVCSPNNSWIKLDGSIDPTRNMITVATNHFSLYDPKVLTRGLNAPQVIREMSLSNPHTYPNPWRAGDGLLYFNIDADSSFNTQAEGTAGTLYVTVEIYNVAGKKVKTMSNTVTGLATLAGAVDGTNSNSGVGLDLASWDLRNNAGSNVASGVYLYHMTVSDGFKSRSVTGKLAVIK